MFQIKLTVVDKDSFFVDITKKYFGHEDVPEKVSVYTADPIEFLEQAALKSKPFPFLFYSGLYNSGEKYNFIIIDHSYDWDETGTGLICPIPDYLDENVIMNIYDALEDDG